LWCPRAREDVHPSSKIKSKFTFSLPFCSAWALNRLDGARPHRMREGLPNSARCLKYQSLPETPSQTHPEITLYDRSK
jgi:hypothetical protein